MGITRGTQKGHIARAALEAIAMRTREIVIEMQKDANTTFKTLKVDGGASTNDLLMQIQSDLLQVEVIRPQTTETTALGVAFFAGLATGFWPSIESLSSIWKVDRKFTPQKGSQNENVIKTWQQKISQVTNA
jgi:glycerol kinase